VTRRADEVRGERPADLHLAALDHDVWKWGEASPSSRRSIVSSISPSSSGDEATEKERWA